MAYVIDIHLPAFTQQGAQIVSVPPKLVPCTIQPSTQPGMYLCVLENGKSVCVEPDGTHVRDIDAGAGNWDSPWTQAGLYGDKLVYRSSGGVPRCFMVIK